eukprot:30798_1
MTFLFVSLALMMLNYPCLSVFTTGTSTLPRTANGVAIGYDSSTNTILIFGGGTGNNGPENTHQFVTFNINDHTFTDEGQYYLTSEQAIDGWSQDYMQIGSYLWMLSVSGTYFVKANTETHEITIPSTTFPATVDDAACLSGTEEYLFVIGGGDGWGSDPMNIAQIYRLRDSQWLQNVPFLNTKRMSLSCIASGDKLYAIGGDEGSTYLDSIETLDISNMEIISSKTWDINWVDTLTSGRKGTRAVLYGTDIYVIGGKDNNNGRVRDINVIDTITGTVSSGDTLVYVTSYASSIIAGNTLYVFGGYSGGDLNTYQYSVLPTKDPTAAPTLPPTDAPTLRPSENPTSQPSDVPTLPPTNKPSHAPTLLPSIIPTLAPSQIPTKRPSTPSISAIMQPTAAMTDDETLSTFTDTKTTDNDDDAPRDRNLDKAPLILSISDMMIIVAVLAGVAAIVIVSGTLVYWYAHKVTRVISHKSPEPMVEIGAAASGVIADEKDQNNGRLENEGDGMNTNDHRTIKQQNKPVSLERTGSLAVSDNQQSINPEGHNDVIVTDVTHDGGIYNMAQDEFVIRADSLDVRNNTTIQ